MRLARRLLLSALLAATAATAQAPAAPETRALSSRQYTEDFDAMWRAIDAGDAYLDRGRQGWRRARDAWRPRAAKAATRAQFVAALEGALALLRDDHASLSESTPGSPRRVPAETDLWAAWKDGAATIEAVRTYSDADVAGLHPGQVVTRIGAVPVERAVREVLGAGSTGASERDWALRHALAGPRVGTLRVEVSEGRGLRTHEVERAAARAANGAPLIGRRMGEDRDLGYIRIKAPLTDAALPAQLDGALNYLKDTRALILDLREVGPAGSHDVTRAIIGRFVEAEAPWQVRESRAGARSVDTVAPRGTAYRAPVVVLVDRWTAGEGEALATGMNAAAKARLVGTPMAGLRGELAEVRLPHSGIVVRFPGQRTLHPDGTPRELVRPSVPVNLSAPQGGPGDPILYQALKLLERK